MSIASAPFKYSQEDQNRLRDEIRRMHAEARKRLQDVEITPNERLIVHRLDGTRCVLQFNDDGTVETVAI